MLKKAMELKKPPETTPGSGFNEAFIERYNPLRERACHALGVLSGAIEFIIGLSPHQKELLSLQLDHIHKYLEQVNK